MPRLSWPSDRRICAAYVSGQGYPARAVESIEATIAATIPADACSPLQNGPELAGAIVLIVDRGGECPLAERVLRAQSLAALAVIVIERLRCVRSRAREHHRPPRSYGADDSCVAPWPTGSTVCR